MTVKDIAGALEAFAPLRLQEDYDNAGLITGCAAMEVTGAVTSVDATEEVLDEAIALGANMVVAHHPIVFRPLRSIGGAGNVDRVVVKAIRNDIAIYACHTNLDRAHHGMSYVLAQKLGLRGIEVLDPEEGGTGFGAVGELDAPVGAMEFLRTVKEKLGIGCVRHSGPCADMVRRVALVTGAGGDGLERAIAAGADVFLTADVRYDRFFAAERRILLADIGHFESEFCAGELIFDIIRNKFPNFALHKSAKAHNPVNYLV
jgi:dinuclear metal center YbgI/SA1388 family protein